MRAIVMLLLSCALFVGCKHTSPSQPKTAADSPKKGTEKAASQPAAKTSVPKETPLKEVAGKVASVNSNLRFVVIDFSLGPVPQVDQKMNVYRQGQKVGEIKISSQARNNIIAADITAGDASVGDEVRSN
jgi:hypothetical protein